MHSRSSIPLRHGLARRLSLLVIATLALGAGVSACGDDSPAPASTPPTATAPATSPASAALVTQTPVTFTYDALGRVKTVEYPSATRRVVLTYDKAGNWSSRAVDTTITNPTPALPPAP
jgi:hypothetical protein